MKVHDVQMIDFEGTKMILAVDGQAYSIDLRTVSKRLADATDVSRRSYSISPSGYGIHWPLVDEDLTVDGLISAGQPMPPKTSEAAAMLKEQKS
jgi:hypothetical protein